MRFFVVFFATGLMRPGNIFVFALSLKKIHVIGLPCCSDLDDDMMFAKDGRRIVRTTDWKWLIFHRQGHMDFFHLPRTGNAVFAASEKGCASF